MKSKASSSFPSARGTVSFLVAIFVVVFTLGRTSAAVINATSGSFAAVKAAVAQAQPGDTVVIPPGTNSWSGLLTISGITLQGSGTNSTTIIDESPPTGIGTDIIQMSAGTNFLTRITQIQFACGVTNKPPFNNYNGMIQVYGGAPLWRIDHCVFSYLTAKNIRVGDGAYGLIDHNTFKIGQDIFVLEAFDTGYGDASWAAPAQFGSGNAIYFEDNYVYAPWYPGELGGVDISNGARVVLRHNQFVNTYVNTHGTETSQRFRSVRYIEAYNNNFSWGPQTNYNDLYTAIDIRGGTALIYSNTVSGYNSVATIHYYRATDNDTAFNPFFGATGVSGWDSNSPAIISGKASIASSSQLLVSNAGWTANQWVGYTVYNASNNLMGVVSANTANTMSFQASRTPIYQLKFNAGDPFVVHWVYPALDAPGMGQGDLLTGDNPTPVWLHQKSEPIHIWGNTLYTVFSVATLAASTIGSPFASMKVGTDILNSAPTDYTAFTYPHPLALGTNAVVVVAPPIVKTLIPPTDLNVRGP